MERKVYADLGAFHEQNKALGTGLPFAEDTSILGNAIQLGSKTVPNRLVCQAMEGCDGTPTGEPDTLTLRRYDRLARGGAGMIWFEATAVTEDGRANPRQLWIREDNLDNFKRAVSAIKEAALKENGIEPVVVMQATHSGRYSKPHGRPEPIIAYSNPLFEGQNPIPAERIATDEQLDSIGEALVKGATLAERAGFDGVDIKCCHRYLNSELLSAYHRPGRYGGTLENRTRLLRESVEGAIASTSKDFLVTSRLNVYDGFEYPLGFGVKEGHGTDFDPTEPEWLLKKLSELGVPFVNVTMGNPYFNPHVNRPFASGGYEIAEHPLEGVARVLHGTALLKRRVPEMKLICSAVSYLGVAAPHVLAAFLESGGFDLAGFGRTILAYPDFARDVLKTGEMNPKKLCLCCSKCTAIMRTPGGTPGCVIRDKEIYLPLYRAISK